MYENGKLMTRHVTACHISMHLPLVQDTESLDAGLDSILGKTLFTKILIPIHSLIESSECFRCLRRICFIISECTSGIMI